MAVISQVAMMPHPDVIESWTAVSSSERPMIGRDYNSYIVYHYRYKVTAP